MGLGETSNVLTNGKAYWTPVTVHLLLLNGCEYGGASPPPIPWRCPRSPRSSRVLHRPSAPVSLCLPRTSKHGVRQGGKQSLLNPPKGATVVLTRILRWTLRGGWGRGGRRAPSGGWRRARS